MTQYIISFFQNTKTQIIAVFSSAAYITTLLFVTYTSNMYREDIAKLEPATSIAQILATPIEAGIHFNAFPSFSIKDAKFTFDGIVWFKFDQGTESIETLETFTIQNMVLKDSANPIYKSKPLVKILGKKVMVSYHVQATFITDINYSKFPIGDHRVNLIIQNRDVTSRELLFNVKPENITFNQNLMVDNWKPVKSYANSGVVKARIGTSETSTNITYPGFCATIDFENVGIRSLISLYFPLFILFFIGLLSLAIGIFDPARLGIIAASLPTLVLFRLVIDAVSPEIGYTTHIDFIYYLLVALSFPILFFQTYVILFIEKTKNYSAAASEKIKKKLETINGFIFSGTLLTMIVIITWEYFR